LEGLRKKKKEKETEVKSLGLPNVERERERMKESEDGSQVRERGSEMSSNKIESWELEAMEL